MTQLFTVHFTTKQIVSQFDAKGRKTGEYQIDYPQTLHALPHSTAETYKKFDNFSIEPYYADVSKRPFETKKTGYSGVIPSARSKPSAAPKVSAGSTARSAAASGNLAAAINAGAK